MKHIVIIGTGLAGYALAKAFRRLDRESQLSLITADEGSFYTKPLLSNALTQKKHPDDIPVFDASMMASQLGAKIYTFSPVSSIDTENKQIVFDAAHTEQKPIGYTHLVFASGALKNQLPVSQELATKIHSVNSLQDYKKFHDHINDKEQIKIIGSGLVGSEFANDLANIGKQIEVTSIDPFPLSRFLPEPIGLALKTELQNLGVQWRLNSAFSESKLDSQTALLSAIGLHPNINLAAKANVYCEKGICVDAYLQTNQKNIYALGDCAQIEGKLQQFVAPIAHCAKALAKTLAGELTQLELPPLPVIVKTPACPIAFLIPTVKNIRWEITGEKSNWQGLCYDKNNVFQGFALSGDQVKNRTKLAKQVKSASLI